MKPASDHNAEIVLLGVIAVGVCILAGLAIRSGSNGDAGAWSAVLMGIVAAIKERWQARTIDRMGQQLGTSTPAQDTASGKPGDPVHTVDEGAA